jgi:hypothetical protein
MATDGSTRPSEASLSALLTTSISLPRPTSPLSGSRAPICALLPSSRAPCTKTPISLSTALLMLSVASSRLLALVPRRAAKAEGSGRWGSHADGRCACRGHVAGACSLERKATVASRDVAPRRMAACVPRSPDLQGARGEVSVVQARQMRMSIAHLAPEVQSPRELPEHVGSERFEGSERLIAAG